MTDSIFESNSGFHNEEDELPGPRGKAIGFLDSVVNAGSLKEALSRSGVPDTRVEIFYGTEGEHAWEEMMGASTWGEQAEKFLKQGVAVLNEGRAIFAVRVTDRQEAQRIAELAKTHGAHTVTYFGELVDTVLTA